MTICFLAEGLRAGKREADGVEEEHLVVERVSLSSVDDLIATGDIADAKTIAGLFLARSFLSTSHPGDRVG
jgi:23S rRNA G2069 N7-methylase RlmK/C1962 C5-methylase RlmI